MPSETIVVALGGNSILSSKARFSIHQEITNIEKSCAVVSKIVRSGYRVVLTHGNGPQVGDLMIAQESAKGKIPELPLDVIGAQSQGELGYLMQRTLRKHLPSRNIVTIITQVVVSGEDSAFAKPSKFVGPFLRSRPESHGGRSYMKDSDRGFRRVVASPEPVEIVERKEIRKLVESGFLVIACGGGGIPVIKTSGGLRGAEGVIDKDFAAERLASSLGARTLLIMTDVPCAYAHYATRLQKPLGRLTLKEAEVYMLGGNFPPGSMGPKMEATLRFIRRGGRRAIITDRENAIEALRGREGTIITR